MDHQKVKHGGAAALTRSPPPPNAPSSRNMFAIFFRAGVPGCPRYQPQIGGDRRRQTRRMWKLRFPALRAEAEVLQVRCARRANRTEKHVFFLGGFAPTT